MSLEGFTASIALAWCWWYRLKARCLHLCDDVRRLLFIQREEMRAIKSHFTYVGIPKKNYLYSTEEGIGTTKEFDIVCIYNEIFSVSGDTKRVSESLQIRHNVEKNKVGVKFENYFHLSI